MVSVDSVHGHSGASTSHWWVHRSGPCWAVEGHRWWSDRYPQPWNPLSIQLFIAIINGWNHNSFFGGPLLGKAQQVLIINALEECCYIIAKELDILASLVTKKNNSSYSSAESPELQFDSRSCTIIGDQPAIGVQPTSHRGTTSHAVQQIGA